MGIRVRNSAVLAAVGLVTVASLGLFGWQQLAAPPTVVDGATATVDGLTAEVRQAGWVDFDHGHVMDLDGGGGFMMPDEMMPGAPSMAGDEVRLRVDLTLLNTDRSTLRFNPREEFLVVADAGTAPLAADTFDQLNQLAPDAAANGTLYFDIDASATAADDLLYLQWQRNGSEVRVELPLTEGDGPPAQQHQH